MLIGHAFEKLRAERGNPNSFRTGGDGEQTLFHGFDMPDGLLLYFWVNGAVCFSLNVAEVRVVNKAGRKREGRGGIMALDGSGRLRGAARNRGAGGEGGKSAGQGPPEASFLRWLAERGAGGRQRRYFHPH